MHSGSVVNAGMVQYRVKQAALDPRAKRLSSHQEAEMK